MSAWLAGAKVKKKKIRSFRTNSPEGRKQECPYHLLFVFSENARAVIVQTCLFTAMLTWKFDKIIGEGSFFFFFVEREISTSRCIFRIFLSLSASFSSVSCIHNIYIRYIIYVPDLGNPARANIETNSARNTSPRFERTFKKRFRATANLKINCIPRGSGVVSEESQEMKLSPLLAIKAARFRQSASRILPVVRSFELVSF